VEVIDGRRALTGWAAPGFDDTGWEAPIVLGRHPTPPFTHLQPQDVDLTFTCLDPVEVTELPAGTIADFGGVVPAVPVVGFERGEAGREVPMRAGYLRDADGSVSRSRGVQKTDLSWRYIQRDGSQTFEPFTYLGFRYLQLDHLGDSPRPSLCARVQHTDVGLKDAATFACADKTVTDVFRLCMRSALYSSQWQFLDTPTREKGQFLADAVNISAALMAGYGDRALTRKAIREFTSSRRRYWADGRINAVYPNGDGARDIPDFTELFPDWIYQYYMETGDLQTLAEAYPVAVGVGDYLLRHRGALDGLLTDVAGGAGDYAGGIVDWPPSMRYGYDMRVAARTTVNLLAVHAWQRICAACGALGRDPAEVGRFATAASRLTEAINRRLRREDGIYVDGLHRDGSRSTHASQIANAYALAFGVVPTSDADRVCEYVVDLGMQMGPMTAHRLLEALAAHGRTDVVVERLRDRMAHGWANILSRGATFTWETWDALDIDASLSHGWGATALMAIQRYVLGVAIVDAGAGRLRISPAARYLKWACGEIPSQRGRIRVGWQRTDRGVTMELVLPANVQAELHLQTGAVGPAPVMLASPGERANGRETRVIGGGRSLIELQLA